MRFITPLVLLAACSAPPGPAPAAPPARIVALPLELADAGGAAAGLWLRAGYDLPSPVVAGPGEPAAARVLVESGAIAGCNTDGGQLAWGCTERALWPGDVALIRIADTVPPEYLVSVLAHEFGHYLGFEHTEDGTLMDPNRGDAARRNPCVDSVCEFDPQN